MHQLSLSIDLMSRLQERAKQQNLSLEVLLERWLDHDANSLPSRNVFKTITDHASDIVALLDRDFRHLYINPGIERITGLSPAEMIGKSSRELQQPEAQVSLWETAMCRVLETGQEEIVEFDYPTLAGQRFYQSHITPVVEADGSIQTLVCVTRDITSNKLAETQLRQLSQAVEQSPVCIMITDTNGDIQYVNPQFTRVTGYTTAEVLGENPRFLKSGHTSPEQYRQMWGTISTGGEWHGELLNKKKNGELYWESVVMAGVKNQHGEITHYVSVKADITQRKQADETLRASEERYRAISDLISDYAYSYRVEANGQVVQEWATDSFTRISGYSQDEISPLDVHTLYHPEDREQARKDVERVLAGEEITAEYRFITKSGETRWMRLYRRPVWDGQQQRVVRFYGVAQDITAYKQVETANLEQKRLETVLKKEQEWNAAMQRMMKVLSHELRNPLTVISSIGDILQHYSEQLTPERRLEKIKSIRTQVQRMTQVLEDITLVVRGMSSRVLVQAQPCYLDRLCKASVKEMQETLGTKHQLVFVTDSQVQQVVADETLISRILVNLLSNAIKYSPAGSVIRLELGLENNEVMLRVVDQGIGIAPEEQSHIFDTFYRAKNVGSVSGTGLGLSIVRDCLKLHKGSIAVQSNVGEGATFIVRLPFVPA